MNGIIRSALTLQVLSRVGKQIMANSNWRNKEDRISTQANLYFPSRLYLVVLQAAVITVERHQDDLLVVRDLGQE
jgi:hypothetical protein